MSDRFETNARTVTLLTLVSRVTGLARDAALARLFGISAIMDAFWFAFMVPNLFRRLFGEGALSAAFLPEYTRLDRDDPAMARRLATLTIGGMALALGGVTIVGEILLWALSTRHEHGHDALRLMMVMLPYMPLVCLVAIMGAMLQVHGRFGPTAAAPIVLNLFLVGAAMGYALLRPDDTGGRGHVMIVSISVLLAGVAQVTWSLAALRRWKWWVGSWAQAREAMASMRRVLGQAWPMFIGLGVLQVNVFLDDLIASYPTTVGPTIFGIDFPLQEGALTAVNNAQRLYEFPLGVFGIAVATAIFPALARVNHDAARFADILRRGLRLVMFIGLPASAGLMLVREPLTAVIYQGAQFTAEDTRRVAFVLMGYAPAIWAYSMTHTLTRAFYARGDSMTPVKVAIGMVGLNLALNLSLIFTPLREAGLAWSTAICSIVQVLILLRLTRRYAAHVIDRCVLTSWARTAGATAVMAGAVWSVSLLLPAGPHGWGVTALHLLVLVGVGGAVVAGLARVMGMAELGWAVGRGGDRGDAR